MQNNSKRGVFQRFVRLMTFLDLPIRRKFTFFAVGVLFWFVLLAGVAFYILLDVNIKTAQVVNSLLPDERFAQDTLRKANEIDRLVDDLLQAGTEQVVSLKSELLKTSLISISQAVEQLDAPEVQSPIRMVWDRLAENSWLDRQGNKTYLQLVKKSTATQLQLLNEMSYLKVDQVKNGQDNRSELEGKSGRFGALKEELVSASVEFLESISHQTKSYSTSIGTTTSYAFWIMMTVLFLACGLLAIFTFWISDSIVLPVSSMIEKIHTLATGHVDLTDKIEIRSDDEIGEMSREFNDLMDTVHGMTVFKNVIEEDATLEDVYSRMGEAFCANVGIENYRIYEVTSDGMGLMAAFPLLLPDKKLSCQTDILTSCELCRAIKTGHAISSLAYDRVCKQFLFDQNQVHICIPMIIGGHAGGVVQFVFDKEGEYALSRLEIEQRVAKAEAYIKQSLSVIEAKRLMNTLRESALRDPMTGLFNRRFLQDQGSHLVAGSLRRKKNIALLMCDLDFFKQVNDKYGHDVGDVVLKESSAIIAKSVRESDVVIRFGGEEFLVILTDVEVGDAFAVAEKIRTNIEEKTFVIGTEKFSKTISIGISEFPEDSDGFWQAIKFADVALYQAKEMGRNKSLRFVESMWTAEEF
ncbi:MAG: sensor domain-containing diguanylate cyclase [Desulfuromusa sp.]|jgi:two-component system cell cycle response regulator|nr:sensor domain-containing diguanylate cyclase [Desulfuromusa sp.]